MVAADLPGGDADDEGHENDGEESADVEDQQLFAEVPGEGEQKQDDDAEENVAADRGARPAFVRGEADRWGGQLALLRGSECEMQIVCAWQLRCGSAECGSGIGMDISARGGSGREGLAVLRVNRRSFDCGTHDGAVSTFAQDDIFFVDPFLIAELQSISDLQIYRYGDGPGGKTVARRTSTVCSGLRSVVSMVRPARRR